MLSASLLGSMSHYALGHSQVPVLIVQTDPSADRTLDRPGAASGGQAAITSSGRPAVAGA